MPFDLFARLAVENEADRQLVVLPNATGDCEGEHYVSELQATVGLSERRTIVTVTQLVSEAVALFVEEKAADAAQRLRSEELDLGIRLVRVDETSRVDLDFVEIDTVRANLEGHLGTVTLTVLAVRRRQVEEIRAVLGEQAIFREIRSKASWRMR